MKGVGAYPQKKALRTHFVERRTTPFCKIWQMQVDAPQGMMVLPICCPLNEKESRKNNGRN